MFYLSNMIRFSNPILENSRGMNPVISAIIFARAQLSTVHKPGIFIIYRPNGNIQP